MHVSIFTYWFIYFCKKTLNCMIIIKFQFFKLLIWHCLFSLQAHFRLCVTHEQREKGMTDCVWNGFVKTTFILPLWADGVGEWLFDSVDLQRDRYKIPNLVGRTQKTESLLENLNVFYFFPLKLKTKSRFLFQLFSSSLVDTQQFCHF